MTLSLAAVFIPLVLMAAMGRILREFSLTIVISFLARDGRMCRGRSIHLRTSRMLGDRGAGAKKPGWNGVWPSNMRAGRYGVPCGSFFAVVGSRRNLGALLVARVPFSCCPGIVLPVGDSSVLRGILVAQEGILTRSNARLSNPAEKDH